MTTTLDKLKAECLKCQHYQCPNIDGVLVPGCEVKPDGNVVASSSGPGYNTLVHRCDDFERRTTV